MRLPKRGVRRLVELIDLSRDGELNECSLDQRYQRGTAVFALACPFCGIQGKCWAGEIVSKLCGVKVQRGSVRKSRVRFCVCEFSVGHRSASSRMRSCKTPHEHVVLVVRFRVRT